MITQRQISLVVAVLAALLFVYRLTTGQLPGALGALLVAVGFGLHAAGVPVVERARWVLRLLRGRRRE